MLLLEMHLGLISPPPTSELYLCKMDLGDFLTFKHRTSIETLLFWLEKRRRFKISGSSQLDVEILLVALLLILAMEIIVVLKGCW